MEIAFKLSISFYWQHFFRSINPIFFCNNSWQFSLISPGVALFQTKLQNIECHSCSHLVKEMIGTPSALLSLGFPIRNCQKLYLIVSIQMLNTPVGNVITQWTLFDTLITYSRVPNKFTAHLLVFGKFPTFTPYFNTLNLSNFRKICLV